MLFSKPDPQTKADKCTINKQINWLSISYY